MNLRDRARRSLILVAALSVIFASGAFADNHIDEDSVPVTLTALGAGERGLAVTGASGTPPVPTSTAASLGFGSSSTDALFGVTVTDVAYDREHYHVTGQLSQLYPQDPSDLSIDCGASAEATIPSHLFEIQFENLIGDDDVEAALETVLEFTGDITDSINTVFSDPLATTLLTLLGAETDIEVEVDGLPYDLATALELMTVANGIPEVTFDAPVDHPACDEGFGSPTSVLLQRGDTNDPGPGDLQTELFDELEDGGAVDVTRAIGMGILPLGADEPGGAVYDATRDVLEGLLGVELDGAQLDDLTAEVVNNELSVADATDLALDLVGQTGVYKNVPKLVLNRDALDVPTGLYHGVLTVTLYDGTP